MIKMDLPLIFVLIFTCLSTVYSRPKDTNVLPKQYYERQILQPLPGYIPVYIRTDGVDVSENRGSIAANGQTQKTSNLNLKSKTKYNDGKVSAESKNFSGKNPGSGSNARKIELLTIKENHEKNSSNNLPKVM